MKPQSPFKWRHCQAEIILLCVRWYLRYSLSYRDLEELMLERGLTIDHTTISRWVQCYAPELEKRCRPHLKATTDSWWVDETYVKVKGTWMYRYRAVDSAGNTLEFLLSATRDAQAAKRFFCSSPGSKAYGGPSRDHRGQKRCLSQALRELQAAGTLAPYSELRQVKYLNNRVEQDHRFIKRLVKPGLGFSSFDTSCNSLQGYEIMSAGRKGQIRGVAKGSIRSQVTFIAGLFGVAA
jgi:IS6 family transposase